MNVYDSARMADVLAPHGYRVVDDARDADLIILNTCHIREKAAEKVYSELGRLRRQRDRDGGRRRGAGHRPLVAVAGCVAQAEGAEISRRAPFVDIIVGPQAYHRLPDLIADAVRAGTGAVDTEFPAEPKFDQLPEALATTAPGSAFVTVQEGCDKFCAFCVVPYTRGAEYSRPLADVVDEVRRYVALGACEISLLGQNVNAYHGAGPDGQPRSLAQLIAAVAAVPGVSRIRYTTSHPVDMDDALIDLHGHEPKLMPFLHLPVQSGSDTVLAAMNRHYTADDYRRIVDRVRAARPDLALATDLIVGFPGESDADFRATLRLVADCRFAQAYSFKFSPRSGTPAAAAPQVAEAVKDERLAELQSLLDRCRQSFNEACVGRELPVLFDRPGRRAGQLAGRSPYMQAVFAEAETSALGAIAAVRITAAGPNSLAGRLIDGPSA
ncbi:MAG: tRNA (N6-isopentenyl adenosine(37)-C2)-methylthiotransferase MiaB [Rhodospirillales bacterium]|nr:tRNA (N6-isopentenyl adenosine(37)-C2)-methylthiotransferase MiaB [Rhodospirillales bacterium]